MNIGVCHVAVPYSQSHFFGQFGHLAKQEESFPLLFKSHDKLSSVTMAALCQRMETGFLRVSTFLVSLVIWLNRKNPFFSFSNLQ